MPVSFSVGCNLEGVETVHVSSKDPVELTAKLVGTLLKMAKKSMKHVWNVMNIFLSSWNN